MPTASRHSSAYASITVASIASDRGSGGDQFKTLLFKRSKSNTLQVEQNSCNPFISYGSFHQSVWLVIDVLAPARGLEPALMNPLILYHRLYKGSKVMNQGTVISRDRE